MRFSLSCRLLISSAALVLSSPAFSAPDPLALKVTLSDGVTTVTRTRHDLGFTIKSEKPVQFSVDLTTCKRALERIAKSVNKPAVNAKPVLAKEQIRLKPGVFARTVNIVATADSILKNVSEKPGSQRFSLIIEKKPPVLTVDRLKGVNGILSDFTTRTSDNPKRNHNIRTAIGRIGGTLLSPKECFSLNKYVGKRTQANGFLTAPVFEDGKKVPGIGGGVSQVSGTLFNAAALAGLQIDAAQPHSRPVAYLPLGRDTTASDEGIDLKFTNDTSTPIYIAYTLTRNKLRAVIFGRKVPGRKIVLRTQIKKIKPGKIDAQTFRIVRQNGKVTAKTKLLAHKYRWEPESKKGA